MSEPINDQLQPPPEPPAKSQPSLQDELSSCQELRQELDNRGFLLKIVLFKVDVEGYNTPPPYYFKISRNFFLWNYLPEIKDFFDYYAISVARQDNWFEYKGQPLPFDVPFGVLFDLFFNDSFKPKPKKNLKIIFHYRNYPKNLSVLRSAEALNDLLLHSIKEAVYVRSGKNSIIKNELMKDDKLYLFQCFKDQKPAEFQSALEKFQKHFTEGKLPLKIFLKKSKALISKNVEIGTTLLQFLRDQFPKVFEDDGLALREEFKALRVLCAGIEVPLTLAMTYFDAIFSYVDLNGYVGTAPGSGLL